MTAPDPISPPPSRSSLTARVVSAPFSLGEYLGHNGRGILGAVIILADIALLIFDARSHEAITMPDVALHLGMFVGGLALIDREKVADIIKAWKGGA